MNFLNKSQNTSILITSILIFIIEVIFNTAKVYFKSFVTFQPDTFQSIILNAILIFAYYILYSELYSFFKKQDFTILKNVIMIVFFLQVLEILFRIFTPINETQIFPPLLNMVTLVLSISYIVLLILMILRVNSLTNTTHVETLDHDTQKNNPKENKQLNRIKYFAISSLLVIVVTAVSTTILFHFELYELFNYNELLYISMLIPYYFLVQYALGKSTSKSH